MIFLTLEDLGWWPYAESWIERRTAAGTHPVYKIGKIFFSWNNCLFAIQFFFPPCYPSISIHLIFFLNWKKILLKKLKKFLHIKNSKISPFIFLSLPLIKFPFWTRNEPFFFFFGSWKISIHCFNLTFHPSIHPSILGTLQINPRINHGFKKNLIWVVRLFLIIFGSCSRNISTRQPRSDTSAPRRFRSRCSTASWRYPSSSISWLCARMACIRAKASNSSPWSRHGSSSVWFGRSELV